MSSPSVPLRDGDRRRLPPSPRTVVEAATLTDPVDELHLWSDAALAVIRNDFADARRRAAEWEPQPWDPDITNAATRLEQWVRP